MVYMSSGTNFSPTLTLRRELDLVISFAFVPHLSGTNFSLTFVLCVPTLCAGVDPRQPSRVHKTPGKKQIPL